MDPVWFEGSPLLHPDYVVDKSGEVGESSITEGSGTINESKMAESDKAHFRESEDISQYYNGQEDHRDNSE